MHPSHYIRLLRRRWVFLILLAAIGAAAGYATTLRQAEVEGPVTTYWVANEILVLDSTVPGASGTSLERIAPFATLGDVPVTVADQLGVPVEDLVIRTVSDRTEGTLTISAAATDVGIAVETAELISTEFVDALLADAIDGYNMELTEANDELDRRRIALEAAEAERDGLATLEAAYNDDSGITAEFNLNLLARMNRELDADFDLAGFKHRALYNAEQGRIEMYLVSEFDQCVQIGDRRIRFSSGETIHTENSYKYTVDGFRALDIASEINTGQVHVGFIGAAHIIGHQARRMVIVDRYVEADRSGKAGFTTSHIFDCRSVGHR